jgi:hypothetical protein
MRQLKRDAREAGEVGGAARRDIEQRSRQPVVSPENYRSLTTQSDHGLWGQAHDAGSALPTPQSADEQDSE